MVNRGGVGAFVASRAAIVVVVATLGGFFLLKHDISSLSHSGAAGVATARANAALMGLPLSFEPNRGQTDPQVKFLARGSGYGLYLTSGEAVLAFPGPKKKNGVSSVSAVSMQFAGKEKVPVRGVERELDHFVLKSEAGDWSMWLDDQFKLVRIVVASDNTEVVRD